MRILKEYFMKIQLRKRWIMFTLITTVFTGIGAMMFSKSSIKAGQGKKSSKSIKSLKENHEISGKMIQNFPSVALKPSSIYFGV